jgi:hypothetical protein
MSQRCDLADRLLLHRRFGDVGYSGSRVRLETLDARVKVELPERRHHAHDAVGEHERSDDGALLVFGQEVEREVNDGEEREVRHETIGVADDGQGGPRLTREFATLVPAFRSS